MSTSDYGDQPLDAEDRPAYQFSQQSYKSPDQRTNVLDYAYDPSLSDENTAVWHDHAHKKTHVSHRGSTTAYDWLVSDAQIATGMEDRGARFQKAVNRTQQAHDKYGYNVSTSGHSLGGTASSYVTEKLGDKDWYEHGTGFNQGNSSLGRDGLLSRQRRACRRKRNRPKYCDKQTNVKEKGDYVSQRNLACVVMTFGFGKCEKKDAFGKTKTYDHRKNRRWYNQLTERVVAPLRFFNNGKGHSLDTFAS